MGVLGERVSGRDVAIGVVLALAWVGLLFLHYYTAFATQATALLFGNVLAVDHSTIATSCGLALLTLAALTVIMRPLMFASLQPKLAEAKGVPVKLRLHRLSRDCGAGGIGVLQSVGILFVFALMVGPPATAQRLVTGTVERSGALAVLALADAWLGIAVAY